MTALANVAPSPKAVKDLLEGLIGRDVEPADGAPIRVEDLKTATVSVYVDDNMRLAAVSGMDLPLAASVGAAIGLVPRGGAEAAVEDGELTGMVADNVGEVCNVMAALLNRDGAPHLKLHQVFLPGDTAPSDAIARLLALGNRLDLTISVTGYLSGRYWLSIA